MDKLFTVDNITKGGIIGLLLLILITGFTEVWVYGPTHRSQITNLEKQLNAALAEREEWRKEAVEGLKLSRQFSPARIPVMGSRSMTDPKTMTPQDIRAQLDLLKTLNSPDNEVEQ